MSRLRRDRQAMRWARYTARNESELCGIGNNRDTRSSWNHLGWMLSRKIHTTDTGAPRYERQVRSVMRLFYNW